MLNLRAAFVCFVTLSHRWKTGTGKKKCIIKMFPRLFSDVKPPHPTPPGVSLTLRTMGRKRDVTLNSCFQRSRPFDQLVSDLERSTTVTCKYETPTVFVREREVFMSKCDGFLSNTNVLITQQQQLVTTCLLRTEFHIGLHFFKK